MKTQIKYAFRSQRLMRLYILLPVMLVQIFCGLKFGYENLARKGNFDTMPDLNHSVVVPVIWGISIAAVLSICFIGDLQVIDEAYKITALEYMMPLPCWKRLLARFGVAFIQDAVCVMVFIGEVLLLADRSAANMMWGQVSEIFIWSLLLLFRYWLLIMLIFLGFTLNRTIMGGKRGGRILSFGAGLAAAWLLNLANILFLPFMRSEREGMVLFLSGTMGPLLVLYLLFTVAKAVLLFLLVSYLWEREVNL